jgi:Flp pilus assembly protein TadG
MDPDYDRGSVSLEAAIIAPGLLFLICLAIAAGRIMLAGAAVEAAARAAAREASLARTPAEAKARATTAAQASLQQLRCTSTGVDVDTSGFAVPVGQVAGVKATVRCTVGLSDLVLPGLPGAKTMDATFTSVLDRYRSR